MGLVRLPEETDDHKEEWVAISHDNRLVGHGRKPGDAVASAPAAGLSVKDFSLLWVPDEWPGVRGLHGR